MHFKLTYRKGFLALLSYLINIKDIIEVKTLDNDVIIDYRYYNLDRILWIKTKYNSYHFKDGKLHNLNEAAFITSSNLEYWYIDGIEYNYGDWLIKSKIVILLPQIFPKIERVSLISIFKEHDEALEDKNQNRPVITISKSTSKTSGKNIKNKVFKGVGTPIKESD
jgi:hypothetical protein